MKLLIVEDNLPMRRLIAQIVRRQGDVLVECGDGAQAVAAYRELIPDWVLMDVEMPIMDGITAARAIIADFPEAKIAIVTDHDNLPLREAAAEAGACEYIVKENLADLRRMLAH